MWLDADDRFVNDLCVEHVMEQMKKTRAHICLYTFKVSWENDSPELRSNASGMLEEKRGHEELLAEIVKHPAQTVSFLTCENIMAATSLGWTKAYAAPMRSRWPYPVEALRCEDFPPMALLLQAERIAAINPDKPIVDFMRRSGSIMGGRKPNHFLMDIPQQLQRFLECTDMSDSARVRAAANFVTRKFDQYRRTLAAHVNKGKCPDFTSDVLEQYEALEAKLVPQWHEGLLHRTAQHSLMKAGVSAR
jgi:hypothetical protein